jgi:hypothetical protein
LRLDALEVSTHHLGIADVEVVLAHEHDILLALIEQRVERLTVLARHNVGRKNTHAACGLDVRAETFGYFRLLRE